MRWWISNDPPFVMSIDNAAVKGMDFSTLPTNLWMVEWRDGKGELEYQTEGGENLNGLRDIFIDVVPYCPLFQQFLTKLSGLTLPQAKKVQTDLIKQIFESKRQLPYHYPVAAGDYSWDATDENLFSSLIPSLQNTIAKVNEISTGINAAIPALNTMDGNIASQGNIVRDQVNSNVVNYGNAFKGEIISSVNTNVVNGVNNEIVNGVNDTVVDPVSVIYQEVNNGIVAAGNFLIAWANSPLIGRINTRLVGPDPVGLESTDLIPPYTTQAFLVLPGTAAPAHISHINTVNSVSNFQSVTAGFSQGSGVPWPGIQPVPITNTLWIPVGSTTPVSVTPTESAAIIQGITARSNDLQIKKQTKIGQVNALTTIPAVIAYNVTTGW